MSTTLLISEVDTTGRSASVAMPPASTFTNRGSAADARRLDIALQIKQDLRMGRTYQQGRLNWITATFMTLFHVGAIAALFCFSWKNLAAFCVMYFFAINVGIGMCYHRLLTHRGYRVSKWLEYLITACGDGAGGRSDLLGRNPPCSSPEL
jgi:hypothetical protein